MASLCSAALLRIPILSQSSFTPNTSDCGRVVYLRSNKKSRRSCNAMCASMKPKQVWIRTENKDVMTAAVESGWNTFLFPSEGKELADNWSLIARINPLFIEMGSILDMESKVAAKMAIVKNPDDLQSELENEEAQNVVVDLQDWQIIPAENIVAALQHSQKTVFAISKTPSEAQVFFEALEQGLDGVVLEVDDAKAIFELKVMQFRSYLDKRNEANSLLSLTKATVTGVHVAGMGERACVDLCSLMRPGEGLLVGSFARGLFLVHSECLESNYIASRPFRVNAGPVHAYVAVPGGKTSYLSELRAGKEVLVVDNKGHQCTAIVGRVKIETRPLILVEAKIDMDDQTIYSIFLQNAETVPLICPTEEDGQRSTALPVTSLKIGNQVLLRLQGGARHTGLEIQEFIVEK